MDYTIEPITHEDLETIYALGCGIDDFSADGGENVFWPKETLTRLFASETDVTLKLVVNQTIVGFSFAMIHQATQKATLENFLVQSEYVNLAPVFLKKTEEAIKEQDGQFIMYLFDQEDDRNELRVFSENGFFQGNSHYWLQKNISFSNPTGDRND